MTKAKIKKLIETLTNDAVEMESALKYVDLFETSCGEKVENAFRNRQKGSLWLWSKSFISEAHNFPNLFSWDIMPFDSGFVYFHWTEETVEEVVHLRFRASTAAGQEMEFRIDPDKRNVIEDLIRQKLVPFYTDQK